MKTYNHLKKIMECLEHLTSARFCDTHGCGYEQFGNDDRCAICRLKLK